MASPPLLRAQGSHLIDPAGRVVLYRGVSLSGDSKLPTKPELFTHNSDVEAFYRHREVSFVGRPLPLDTADEHLHRLATIGIKLVRIVVCWEALEHSGPGLYDEEYIAYLAALLEKLPKHGLVAIIDHHMDCWSRLSGGSGAPGWTLELAGFDVKSLHASGAAFIHSEDPSHSGGIWPSNYLATATMYTLFWSGDQHASQRTVKRSLHAQWQSVFGGSAEEPIGLGTFLQSSLVAAFAKLFERLASNPSVVGIEPMNEPHRGYLQLHSFHKFNDKTDLHIGLVPSALQSFALGAGHAQTVPFYVQSFPKPSRVAREELVTPPANGAWAADSGGCIWREHGVWEWSESKNSAVAMRLSYFETNPSTGRKIDFYADRFRPFVVRFAKAAHRIRPDWLVFAGSVPNEYSPKWPKETQPPNLVSAEHFYDLYTLFYRVFGNITFNVQEISRGAFALWNTYIGASAANRNYKSQIENLHDVAKDSTGAPTYFGEVGSPWNINDKRNGKDDDKWQLRALDAIAKSFDELAVPFAWWTYSPTNTKSHGDNWLGEDFSFFSLDAPKQSDPVYSHMRGMDAIERAYPVAVAGVPGVFYYNRNNLDLAMRFRNPLPTMPLSETLKSMTTEVYLPRRRYHDKRLTIGVSDGTHTYNEKTQLLKWTITEFTPGYEHTLFAGNSPDEQKKHADLCEDPPDIDSTEWPWLLILSIALALLVAVIAFAFSGGADPIFDDVL